MHIRWTKALPRARLDDCRFTVHAGIGTVSELLTYYERIRGYVVHEDDLISSRLTWSLTVHGFLFAAFGILASKIVDLLDEINKSHDLIAPQHAEYVVIALIALSFVVALIGAVVGYLSREAITAAHNALQHLFAIVHAEGVLQLPAPGPAAVIPAGSLLLPCIIGGGDRGAHTEGAQLYYLKLPLLMTVVWLLIMAALIVFLIFVVVFSVDSRSPDLNHIFRIF